MFPTDRGEHRLLPYTNLKLDLASSIRYDLDSPLDENITWPDGLARISFGDEFNQRVDAVQWPSKLRFLWMGQDFDQPIEGISWPDDLHQLRFGHAFNQSIEGVRWPESLEVRIAYCDTLGYRTP